MSNGDVCLVFAVALCVKVKCVCMFHLRFRGCRRQMALLFRTNSNPRHNQLAGCAMYLFYVDFHG